MAILNSARALFKPDRSTALRRFAEDHDCDFTVSTDIPKKWLGVGLFDKRRRRLRHHMRKIQKSRAVHISDFGYQLQSGAEKRWQTVVIFDRYDRNLSAYSIYPAKYVNPDQRTLAISVQVSALYEVTTDSPKLLHKVFEDELVEHIEHYPGWVIEGSGSLTAFYKPGELIEPEELSKHVKTASDLFKRLDEALFYYEKKAKNAAAAKADNVRDNDNGLEVAQIDADQLDTPGGLDYVTP